MPAKIKVLFVLKYRETYWNSGEEEAAPITLSSGLANSAQFCCDALNQMTDFQAELVHVIDNSFIDREVTRVRPDIVIIEAFWVVPEKFEILTKLHPTVKWIIRNHSEIPFMSQEGITIDWTIRYLTHPNVFVSGNTTRNVRDIDYVLQDVYPSMKPTRNVPLPNIYPAAPGGQFPPDKFPDLKTLNVGCFGAIRPLKNNFMQAIAAMQFCNQFGRHLRFHINGGRVEGAGSAEILKNLRALFSHSKHELIEHEWMPHEEFMKLLKTLDIGMQVTFSETFNIVAADMVASRIPVVVSPEVFWAPYWVKCDPTNCEAIVKTITNVLFQLNTTMLSANRWYLDIYTNNSRTVWAKSLKAVVAWR